MSDFISRIEQAMEGQQARIAALEAALEPFAKAWECRRTSDSAMARRVREKRQLTDQHLKNAYAAFKGHV